MVSLFLSLERQVFFCCSLTESLKDKVQEYLGYGHADSDGHHVEGQTNLDNIDHESHDGSAFFIVDDCNPYGYRAIDPCFSEHFENANMMVSAPLDIDFPVGIDSQILRNPKAITLMFFTPRPQNKSSPPLYITTLRIQV